MEYFIFIIYLIIFGLNNKQLTTTTGCHSNLMIFFLLKTSHLSNYGNLILVRWAIGVYKYILLARI